MGANRVGEVAALLRLVRPTVGLITNAGAEHLEGFGDLDGVARRRGRDGRRTRRGRDRGHQRRRLVRRLLAAHERHPACADLRRRRTRRLLRPRCAPGHRARRIHHPLHPREPAGRARRSRCAPAVRTTCAMRSRRPRRRRRRCDARRHRGGLAEFRAVSGRLQLKPGIARQLDHRRFLQRQPRFGARGPRRAARARRVRSGSCSATWANSARIPTASHAEVGAYARECGVERLFARRVARRRGRSRLSARAPSGSRMPQALARRARGGADSPASPCSSRARASTASSASWRR